MRQRQPRNWTKEKEAEFLSVLADTCNVTRAAEEAGVSQSGVYKRRKENAAFRAGWLEAISVAYQRLELVLLDRAFNGTEKLVKRRDGSEERMLEYSNQLGLTLLKMHRDTAIEARPSEPEEAPRADDPACQVEAGGPTQDHPQYDLAGHCRNGRRL